MKKLYIAILAICFLPGCVENPNPRYRLYEGVIEQINGDHIILKMTDGKIRRFYVPNKEDLIQASVYFEKHLKVNIHSSGRSVVRQIELSDYQRQF